MSDKPIGERVTFLEATIPSMMEKINKIEKTLSDFIKEIRNNYATKKELNEVKEKIFQEEEDNITKEVAGGNNRTAIIIVIVQGIIGIGIALISLLK